MFNKIDDGVRMISNRLDLEGPLLGDYISGVRLI